VIYDLGMQAITASLDNDEDSPSYMTPRDMTHLRALRRYCVGSASAAPRQAEAVLRPGTPLGNRPGPRAGVRWLESHNEVEASFIAERETTW
jgi:hypothetical protein